MSARLPSSPAYSGVADRRAITCVINPGTLQFALLLIALLLMPNIPGDVFGVEPLPQSVAGETIFIGIFNG